jgi:hypothetical protein
MAGSTDPVFASPGDRLAFLRGLVEGLSAREIDRLAGTEEGHFSAAERGDFTPKPATIGRWALALGVSEVWVTFGTGRPPGARRVRKAVAKARADSAPSNAPRKVTARSASAA